MLNRRTLLAAAAASGLGVLAACTRTPGLPRSSPSPSPSVSSTPGPSLQVTGDREQVLDVGDYGMLNFPDAHMSFLDVAGERRLWVASGLADGGGRAVALDAGGSRLVPADRDSQDDAVPGLVPAGGTTAFDADYSAPGSVFPSADGATLWMLYHAENHTFAGVTSGGTPFYATVGLASSADGGLTWIRQGAVITGQVPRDDRPAPREVVGAGSPCAVVDGDVVHVFYVDWNLDTPDEIHLARVPLAKVDDPSAWLKWHDGSFSSPGTSGASTAVVTRPGDGQKTVYAGNPSVSWNTYLQSYVLVHETADGYWWTRSTDLTTWVDPQQFLGADADQLRDTTYAAYPSLLTTDAPTDRETGQVAHLYLGLGMDGGSHSMWRIPVRFDA